MPLIQSCSADARRQNVAKLISEGRSPEQATAIARSVCAQLRRRTRREDAYDHAHARVCGHGRLDAINEKGRQTAAQVRMFRGVGAAKRPRKRIPSPRQPLILEREYTKFLLSIAKRTQDELKPLTSQLQALLESAERDRLDAGESQLVEDLIERARLRMETATQPTTIDDLVRNLASRVATLSKEQLRRQARAALGVDVFVSDTGLLPIIEGFAAENADLIVDMPAKVIGEIEKASLRAISDATPHPQLAKEIQKRFEIGRNRAKLIARDQIGKLYGQVNATRHQSIGITHFFWQTVNDERVRDEHTSLQVSGKKFAYADGGAPEEGLPGEPILCRCYAEPDFSDILDEA